jgi:hypothetical protein
VFDGEMNDEGDIDVRVRRLLVFQEFLKRNAKHFKDGGIAYTHIHTQTKTHFVSHCNSQRTHTTTYNNALPHQKQKHTSISIHHGEHSFDGSRPIGRLSGVRSAERKHSGPFRCSTDQLEQRRRHLLPVWAGVEEEEEGLVCGKVSYRVWLCGCVCDGKDGDARGSTLNRREKA